MEARRDCEFGKGSHDKGNWVAHDHYCYYGYHVHR